MLTLNAPSTSLDNFFILIHRSLLLLLTFSLLAGTLAAQTEQETKRATAGKLFNEGERLVNEGTKESLEEAIRKFTGALPLYHAVGDRAGEAVTLNNIGALYEKLNEKQKALD